MNHSVLCSSATDTFLQEDNTFLHGLIDFRRSSSTATTFQEDDTLRGLIQQSIAMHNTHTQKNWASIANLDQFPIANQWAQNVSPSDGNYESMYSEIRQFERDGQIHEIHSSDTGMFSVHQFDVGQEYFLHPQWPGFAYFKMCVVHICPAYNAIVGVCTIAAGKEHSLYRRLFCIPMETLLYVYHVQPSYLLK